MLALLFPLFFFFLRVPQPPPSTLFPYTTLFRSHFAQQRFRHPAPRDVPGADEEHLHDAVSRPGWSASASTRDRKSTRLNSSHTVISYAVFCLKKKTSL